VVYRPFALTLPVPAGVMLQVTDAFEEPETVALNCCVWPEYRFALAGLIETPTARGAADVAAGRKSAVWANADVTAVTR